MARMGPGCMTDLAEKHSCSDRIVIMVPSTEEGASMQVPKTLP